jgi:hypothetical protein
MEPYHNPRLRHVNMELARTGRGATKIDGKGGMHTYLRMPGSNRAHSAKETKE